MKVIDFLTTVFGFFTMGFASYLIYSKTGFGSTDYLILTVTGMFLIWFKGDSAKSVIEHLLNSKFTVPNPPPNDTPPA